MAKGTAGAPDEAFKVLRTRSQHGAPQAAGPCGPSQARLGLPSDSSGGLIQASQLEHSLHLRLSFGKAHLGERARRSTSRLADGAEPGTVHEGNAGQVQLDGRRAPDEGLQHPFQHWPSCQVQLAYGTHEHPAVFVLDDNREGHRLPLLHFQVGGGGFS
jgi:hypothetical protein